MLTSHTGPRTFLSARVLLGSVGEPVDAAMREDSGKSRWTRCFGMDTLVIEEIERA